MQVDHFRKIGKLVGVLSVLLGISLLGMTEAKAARSPYRVLITYFEPFHGATENSGDRIAHEVETLLRSRVSKRPSIEVKLCRLPVRYLTVLPQFQECLRGAKRWNLVFGLGQGFEFRIEQVGRLRKSNYADDEKNRVGPEEFEAGLSSTEDLIRYSRFALDEFVLQRGKKTRVLSLSRSEDAGSFVCNYYSMRAAHQLHRNQIPFVFFHVPSPQMLYETKNGWDEMAEDLADFVQIASQAGRLRFK